MDNVLSLFQERGFIERATHEKELSEYLAEGPVTCYIGFDPTAPSLHIGSLVPIMALAQMQRYGHRPIALIGGGTGLVGDPSGKTEMRKLLTPELVENNALGIKEQLSRFIDFHGGKALLLNNAEWLTKIEYIPFLRDIGQHFSVNRMIKAEGYKMRLESEEGLNFIEFNYMLLQAYDFLKLYDNYGCGLQMGGGDQWGNIVAGVELIRRTRQKTAFGITFPLLITSSGTKMGKTAKGAVWLDPDRTTPYEYYQYWINTDDRDVARFMALFTFLPMDEVKAIERLEGSDLNHAKTALAFETTLIAHGREQAVKAYDATASLFGVRDLSNDIMPSSAIHSIDSRRNELIVTKDVVPPTDADFTVTTYINSERLKEGIPAFKLYHEVGLAESGGVARRLINQGGAYINGNRLKSFDYLITDNDLINEEIVLRSGKKRFRKIKIKK